MGAGRKTETFRGSSNTAPSSTQSSLICTIQRNLSKENLGGVIFGCTDNTIKECLSKQLFGLPHKHINYVKNIEPGLPLFLFNYADRKLHGVFEAASPGRLNIDPYGWTGGGSQKTQFPAQVQIRVRLHCLPLRENQYKQIIADNYYSDHLFEFELDLGQTSKLISLFTSSEVSRCSSSSRNSVRSISVLSPIDSREGVQNAWVVPAEHGKTNHISGKLDSSDHFKLDSGNDFPPLGGGNQSSDTHLQRKAEIKDENGLYTTKLKGLTVIQEFQGLDSEDKSTYSSAEEEISFSENNSPKEPVSSNEEQEEKIAAYRDYPGIIDKLFQRIEELEARSTEQTYKLHHLEEKLAKAETEIEYLKGSYSKLDYGNDPLPQNPWESTIEPINLQHMDPRESIILVGGYDTSSWLSIVESYYPLHNDVKSLQPMYSARSYASVVKLNEELYAIGGGNGLSWYDTVESYNVAENTWTSKPSLNFARGSLGGAVLHDRIFALGGGNGLHCFSEVERLDFDAGRWIPARSMLQKRFALAVAEFNGVIYATGGYDGFSYLNSAERFDHRSHAWTRMPNMNSKRGCHSLVVLNEKLYALGGFDGNSMISSVEIFDPRMESWIIGEQMNYSRGYTAAAVLDGSIYVIGGMTVGQVISDSVECYKYGQGWQEVVSTAIGKRCYMSAVVL